MPNLNVGLLSATMIIGVANGANLCKTYNSNDYSHINDSLSDGYNRQIAFVADDGTYWTAICADNSTGNAPIPSSTLAYCWCKRWGVNETAWKHIDYPSSGNCNGLCNKECLAYANSL
ncbi:MAG: hypothetical protein IJX89_01395 [Alphaproteobacteria bacterium]|nr:hypothetical protein [Alphaproteobacteria bacterium]